MNPKKQGAFANIRDLWNFLQPALLLFHYLMFLQNVKPMEVVVIKEIRVMYVVAENGPEGAKKAFDKLEKHLTTLKGRKFYGTFLNEEYMACVELEEQDSPSEKEVSTGIIPGGRYLKKKIENWMENLDKIGSTFGSMAATNAEDKSRPRIEFYRSMKELFLLLPIHDE